MKNIALPFLLLLTACATPDCGSNWREVGANEGRIGARPGMERYEASCPGKFNSAAYAEGYREAFAQRPIPLW